MMILRSMAVLLLALTALAHTNQEGDPTVEEQVTSCLRDKGIDAAVALHQKLSSDMDPKDRCLVLLQHAAGLFSSADRPLGIKLALVAERSCPEDPTVQDVLGQFYWYEEDRKRCIAAFERALELKPDLKSAKQFLDLLYFVPDDFQVPSEMQTKHLVLRPLTAADVKMDFQAVSNNRQHLRGVFGPNDDWPADSLTEQDDLRALKNHEDEHRRRVAFTYTVLNSSQDECLGCLYLVPCHADQWDAQVYMWVTAEAHEQGLDDELYDSVRNWITAIWPFKSVAYPGRAIAWEDWQD